MLRLVTGKKLQVVLSGAATASRVTVSWADFTATTAIGDTTLSVTNGATPVDICAAPAASTTRQIDHIKLVAKAAMTATFSVHDGSAEEWDTVILASGDVYEWRPGGAEIKDANGQVKRVMPGYLPLSGGTISGALIGAVSQDVFNTVSTTVNAFGAASVALNIGHASAAAAFAGGISIPTGKSVTGAGTATVTGFATVSATTLTGTLSTAAQPNVTSGGATFLAGGDAATNPKLIVNGSDATNKFLEFRSAGVAKWQLYSNATTHALSLDTASVNAFTITQAGAVSLGSNSLTAGAINPSGTITSTATGTILTRSGASTGLQTIQLASTGANGIFGIESSTGTSLLTGSTAYATFLASFTTAPVQIGVNGTVVTTFTSAGINGPLGGTTPAAASVTTLSASGAVTFSNHVAGTPTWVTGDKYLVVDSSGHIHVSAVGPAS